MIEMSMNSEIEIFQSPDGQAEVQVTFDKDTVWLNQEQLAKLFDRDRTVIGRHIKIVFKESELDEDVVCADFAHTTHHGAIEGKLQSKTTRYYNLDVIISVGYRVRSIRGTQFRQWASNRLKEYLIQGYAINEKRLEQRNQELKVLRSGLQILGRAIEETAHNEGPEWLNRFAKGLILLDDYDHERLDTKGLPVQKTVYPTVMEYQKLVDQMKHEFGSPVFGIEKDKSFESAIAQIAKGFGDQDFYPSIEEKAAHFCTWSLRIMRLQMGINESRPRVF